MKASANQIYYGVNVDCDVLSDGKRSFARYNTYKSYEEALAVYNVLAQQNEPKLWENVDIEEIFYDEKTCQWKYFVLKSTLSDALMKNKDYWEKRKALNPIIYDFSIEEDYDSDNRVINICWLKLGYMSPSSGCGYFHYSTVEEFKRSLAEVKPLRSCTPKEISEYTYWLSDNECLFNKNSFLTKLEQLARAME